MSIPPSPTLSHIHDANNRIETHVDVLQLSLLPDVCVETLTLILIHSGDNADIRVDQKVEIWLNQDSLFIQVTHHHQAVYRALLSSERNFSEKAVRFTRCYVNEW